MIVTNTGTQVSKVSGDDDIDDSLIAIRDYLEDRYGISFAYEKLYSLEHKLERRLKALSLESFSEYKRYLKDNSDEIHNFLDEVSTNKTAFFREPKHWEFLIETVFPEWITRNQPIKAWSVPCSSGEEPYSLAMLVDDYLENRPKRQKKQLVKVLASDISRDVLRSTRIGKYDEKRLQQVREFDDRYPEKYFRPADDGGYVIDRKLKSDITLRTFNLNEKQYPIEKTFDLILCRNVLIYFEKDVISHVVNELSKCLTPGGYLFIGHTESLYDIDHDLQKTRPSVFRKR
jgi:chemotaxis protein methyltransferase CheR